MTKYNSSNEFHNEVNSLRGTPIKTQKYNNENLDGVKNLDSEYLPKYHLTSIAGLINDPNGLHQDSDGTYYIYYQSSPLYPAHFMKHWGLYTTKDFVNFENKGIVIKPDNEIDKDGVYSGAAFNDEGNVHIFYTGNIVGEDGTDATRGATTSYFNKVTGEKKLLFEVDKEHYTGHFRDPAPFVSETNKKYLLHGAQTKDMKGTLSVYESNEWDGDWKLKGNIKVENLEEPGHMLECPNMINIDGSDLLLFSVQGSNQFHNYLPIDIVVYGLGKYNEDTLEFTNNKLQPLDYGFDFYAPQLFRDNNGRVIMYGWLGNGFNLEYMDANDGYNGTLTLPRELKVVGGKLMQYPVNEINKLATSEIHEFHSIKQKQLKIDANQVEEGWQFILQNEQNEFIEMSYNHGKFVFNRENTSKKEKEWILKNGEAHKNIISVDVEDMYDVSIFIDASTIERFSNDGEDAFTSRFYISGDWSIENENSHLKVWEM